MTERASTVQNNRLGALAPKIVVVAGVLGVAGLGASILIGALAGTWDRLLFSYLVAFIFVLSISLGALWFTLLQHMTRAGWSVVLRRLSEAIAANLPWLALAFLPIVVLVLIGKGESLYHWADPALYEAGSEHFDEVLTKKQIFFNPTFWTIRAVFYFAVWSIAARMLLRRSVLQDTSGDVAHTHHMQKFSPLFMLLYALTQTLAVVDWVMSLEPHWFSTMYGVYFFAASLCGFFSMLTVSVWLLQRSGRLTDVITSEHYQDAGKLLFGFGIVFWAYIAFSQYMLIWYANIPEETGWYITRQLGGWRSVSMLLLFGHFCVPFLLLISRHPKRAKGVLALVVAWMLLMHYVDMYWLVMPRIPAETLAQSETYEQLIATVRDSGNDLGFHPSILDLTCLIGLGGIAIALTARRLRDCALIPTRDPRLGESLAFENM